MSWIAFARPPAPLATNAFDSRDGTAHWDQFVGLGILAPPVTYRVDCKQDVAVVAGWGGAAGLRFGGPRDEAATHERSGRVFTFALGRREKIPLPPARVQSKRAVTPPPCADTAAGLAKTVRLDVRHSLSRLRYATRPRSAGLPALPSA